MRRSVNPGARFCVAVSLDLSAPLTNLPNPRRKKKSGGGQLREHVTGCARSEGYYAISRKEKDVYLDLDLPEQVIREVENVDTSVRTAALSCHREQTPNMQTYLNGPDLCEAAARW